VTSSREWYQHGMTRTYRPCSPAARFATAAVLAAAVASGLAACGTAQQAAAPAGPASAPVAIGESGELVTSNRRDNGDNHSDVQDVTYHKALTTLGIDVAAGDIAVIGDATGDTVQIRRQRSWRGAEPVIDDRWNGTALRTTVDCDSCGVSFEVHVPAAVAATLTTRSGDVVVTGLQGDAVLTSASGDVRARDLAAGTVTAKTSSGDVGLDLATAPTSASAITSAGDVLVAVPGDVAYRVETATSAGDKRVSVRTDPSAPHTIVARSSAGDVTVRAR
jgi:hypothetical protein